MNGQRLRPLGLGDIFDEGFDLYKRNFVFLLLVTALAVVPLDIGIAFAAPRLFPAIFDLFGVTANSDGFWIWLVAFGARMVLYVPLYLLAAAPLIAACAGRYMEWEVTVWSVYRLWLRRLPVLLVSLTATGLALDLGLFFCVVLWLLPAGQFFFVLQAIMVEGEGPFKALGRSGRLANGYGGRVSNCLILLAGIAWVISLGITFPLAFLVDNVLHIAPGALSLLGGTTAIGRTAEQQVVALITSGLTHLVLIPFLACVATVLYYDLRIRKEGFDIELLAEELRYPPLAALGPFLPPAPAFGPVRPGVPPHGAAYGAPRPGAPPPRPPGALGGPR